MAAGIAAAITQPTTWRTERMNVTRRSLLVFTLALLAAPLVTAADTPKAAGTWDVVATTPQGEMQAVLTLKLVDGQPKAEFELAGAPRTVTDEKLAGSVLTLKVEYEGGTYDVEGKIDGDTMTGTWQGGGYSGELKAKRRP
jgi:hypothetical protein